MLASISVLLFMFCCFLTHILAGGSDWRVRFVNAICNQPQSQFSLSNIYLCCYSWHYIHVADTFVQSNLRQAIPNTPKILLPTPHVLHCKTHSWKCNIWVYILIAFQSTINHIHLSMQNWRLITHHRHGNRYKNIVWQHKNISFKTEKSLCILKETQFVVKLSAAEWSPVPICHILWK